MPDGDSYGRGFDSSIRAYTAGCGDERNCVTNHAIIVQMNVGESIRNERDKEDRERKRDRERRGRETETERAKARETKRERRDLLNVASLVTRQLLPARYITHGYRPVIAIPWV